MPTFFRKKELTEEQKNNWDKAIVNYSKVLELNALSQLKAMKDDEKLKLMRTNDINSFTEDDLLKELLFCASVMGNSPGHEKSALFFRLLSGKPVFKNPPPKSYSYPDYGIIESNDKRELMLDGNEVEKLIIEKSQFTSYPHININQSAWKVLEVVSSAKVQLTHSHWENKGFVWELELDEITAEESGCAICCSYDSSIKKLTTYEQLLKECRFVAEEHFYLLNIANDLAEYKKYEEKMSAKYPKEKTGTGMISVFLQNQLNHTLEKAKNMVQERIEKGLPSKPTEEEIQEYAKNREKQYLRDEYFPKNGLLYKKAWMMKRVAPIVLMKEHYLELDA